MGCRMYTELARSAMEKLGRSARAALSYLDTSPGMKEKVTFYGMDALMPIEELQDVAEF